MKKTIILICTALCCAATFAQEINMGVLLPFRTSNAVGEKMVEFYRGVLMAADSMTNSRNVHINVMTFDCGSTANDMGYLLAKHSELRQCDFIIGPQSSTQVPAVAEWCELNNVRLVAPFTTCAAEVLTHKNLFVVSPSRTVSSLQAAELFQRLFAAHNIVSLVTDETNENATALSRIIISNLRLKSVGVPQLTLDASDEQMTQVLSSTKPNVIVVSGASLASVNKVMAMMSTFCNTHPEYACSLVGTQEWANYGKQHIHNYYRFNTFIPTTHFRNPANTVNTAFEHRYIQHFKSDMANSNPRMATMGFDVAWFFMNAVATHGADFNTWLSELYAGQRPLQTPLNFQRVPGGGYTNHGMRYLHYSPDGNVELFY